MIKIKSMLILLLMVLFMVGCQKSEEEIGMTPSVDVIETDVNPVTLEDHEEDEVVVEPVPNNPPTKERGGILRVAALVPDTLNPLINDVMSTKELLDLVYEPLFRAKPDLSLEPILVKEYSFSEDYKSVSIALNDEAIFSDQKPLTAEDVAYTINYIKDLKTSPYKEQVARIKRVSVKDAHTLVLYYDMPYGYALEELVFPILSKTYMTDKTTDKDMPIGSGPYIIKDYQRRQSMQLSINETWYQATPYIETIQCEFVTQADEMLNRFDQNLIDLVMPYKFNWLQYSEKEGRRIEGYVSNYYDFLAFNHTNTLFTDLKVKKALAYAVNREYIIYDQMINHGFLVNSPIKPSSIYDQAGSLAYTYDLEKARKILSTTTLKDTNQDLFLERPDSLNEAEMIPFTLKLLVNGDTLLRSEAALIMAQDFEAIGFDIEVVVLSGEAYELALLEGSWDLLLGGWKLSNIPDFYNLFHTGGSQNLGYYTSETMDQLLTNLVGEMDPIKRKESLATFDQLFSEELPYISLYFLEGAWMSKDSFYGEMESMTDHVLGNFQNMYLDLREQ